MNARTAEESLVRPGDAPAEKPAAPAAITSAEVERLIAQTPGLIAGRLPAFAEAIHHLA